MSTRKCQCLWQTVKEDFRWSQRSVLTPDIFSSCLIFMHSIGRTEERTMTEHGILFASDAAF